MINNPQILEDFCLLYLIDRTLRENRRIMRDRVPDDPEYQQADNENKSLRQERAAILNRAVEVCRARAKQ